MTQISTMLTSIGQALFSSSTTQYHVLGDYIQTPDGRGYRYALAGGTTLVVGKLQQASAEVTANENLSIAAAAITPVGTVPTIVTTSTVTVTANQYAGGFANIDVTPGVGYTYRISSHPAATAAVVTITLEDPIQVALTTSSKVDLVASPFNGVIVNPATATSSPVGVGVYPVVNAQYGWVQTYGPAAVLSDGGTTVGLGLAPSASVAGAVKTMAATLCQVGYALMTFTDTRYNTAYLTIR